MGVVTKISLDELNALFDSYNFINIIPTTSGIIDTTYIVQTKTKSYILKRYERDIKQKIDEDTKLLKSLKSTGLNVSTCRDKKDDWYLYDKLKGTQPKSIQTFHIQSLARFLAKLHNHTKNSTCRDGIIDKNEIKELLKYVKSNFYSYYKKLSFLQDYKSKNDGLIHGDIFKDNTVFDGNKLGVFDFIDSACGSFTFDVAVVLLSFDAKKHSDYFINIFLNTYNQRAVKKLKKQEIIKYLHIAASFYALNRIHKYKNSSKAKELL